MPASTADICYIRILSEHVATLLVARGRIAAAILRIWLKTSTAGITGHGQVSLQKVPPPESTPQTASRSVQPFCRTHACDQQTHEQADHATCVATGCILCYA